MNATERVLVYRLGSLGDTIAALPCFHLIERAFPDAERVVLTNVPVSTKAAPLETILSAGGFIDRSISYPVGTRDPRMLVRLAAKLRRERFDHFVYLAAARGMAVTRRDVKFFRLCGLTAAAGVPNTEDLQNNRTSASGSVERETSRLLRTLAPLGSADIADRTWWDLRLTRSERSAASSALQPLDSRPFIAVNTGGKVVVKDWGTENWGRLLQALSDKYPKHALVFVGAPDDAGLAQRLATHWSGTTLDLCGTLAPRASASVLERAGLFIGHDSGPLHLADAVGTPAIGLFGSYNVPEMWHPSGSTTRVLHHMAGLDTITPELILEAALGLLPRTD